MTLLWAEPAAIVGDDTLDHAGSACRITLAPPPLHTGSSGHVPVSYYGLGVVGWKAGDHYYPPLSLRWRDQILDGRPDDADGIYWQLGAGQSGDLEVGYLMGELYQPFVALQQNVVQAVDDAQLVPLTWGAQSAGIGQLWSIANPTQLICRESGLHLATVQLCIVSATYSQIALYISVNGTLIYSLVKDTEQTNVGGTRVLNGVAQIILNENDYIEYVTYQVSGASRNTTTDSRCQLSRLLPV